jgi:hypothetical protein
MTVEELAAEFGIPAETLAAKPDVVKKWNTNFATTQSDAATKLAAAEKQLQDAQALQRVIDENIRTAGLTETNIAQLQASNAAYAAALDAVKKAGFTGITMPDLPTTTPAAKDPVADLTGLITKGFTQMGQTLNEMNRYQRVFGSPLPEDPGTIADRAASARLSVRDYMEQTYKVSAKEQENAAAVTAKHEAGLKAKWEEEYKAAHPVTMGHPELGGGVPSNFPNIPKPSDAKGVAEMAGKSPMEKIRMARDRVSNEIKTRMAAA